jgi:ribosomal protein S18 acetylase RimI-like enzyme
VVVTAGARLQGVALALMEAVHRDLAARGARFVLAEVPDDAIGRPARELLDRCGYVEDSRVPDFFREGVPLLLLRRELPARA